MTEQEELRLKIAKLKKIKIYNERYYRDGYSGEFYAVPNWPVSIADAWELVDDLPDFALWKSPGEFTCSSDRGTTGFSAPTASMAICYCWIHWKEARNAP